MCARMAADQSDIKCTFRHFPIVCFNSLKLLYPHALPVWTKLQWNLSNMGTGGTTRSVLIREMSLFQPSFKDVIPGVFFKLNFVYLKSQYMCNQGGMGGCGEAS